MRLIRYQNPWVGLEGEINRIFGQAAAGQEGRRFPIEFHEDKDNAYVRVELPGVKKEEIGVEIVDGELKVSATRNAGGDDAANFSYGRTVELPEDVEAEKVAASYENGLLTITLPKREAAKPRSVAIN